MHNKLTGDMIPVKSFSQSDFDKAIPHRKQQRIVLSVGETVSLKGGSFRIESLGKKTIVLRGLPGTHLDKDSS